MIDIAFTRRKIAVFIDGCFWHHCPAHYVAPKANAAFWDLKIRDNVRRDVDTTNLLVGADWLVMRFWEHENPQEVAACIAEAVHRILDAGHEGVP